MNRNRTYISEEFANQLISSLPYTPIKGIFNSDDIDFEGHGDKNQEGRIYGVVMADPNFAWEDHEDIDGVIRSYACADVLLYTALYSEAKLIPGSSQSMEINPYTFEGSWDIYDDGKPFFKFTKGSLFGLQVLGMATEPCFEGAAFYYNLIKDDLQPFISYIKNITKEEEQMAELKFRLSDNEKAHKIFQLLNEGAESYEDIKYWLCNVYDNYAVAQENTAEGGYIRAYYTKNEDTVTITGTEPCFMLDVTEVEKVALEAMKTASGGYEKAAADYDTLDAKVAEMTTEIETLKSSLTAAEEAKATAETDFTSQKETLEATIAEKDAALTEAAEKYSTLESEKIELENAKNDLFNEKEQLAAFKVQIETKEKEQLLSKYSEHLNDELVSNFKENIDKYSVEEFKKEVCTAAVEHDPTIFSKAGEPDRFYKGTTADKFEGRTALERMLNKHINGGNK